MPNKQEQLESILKGIGSAAVAFSAGVDSTYLLKTAHDVLGDNARAVIVKSPLIPGRDISEAEKFCAEQGIKLNVIEYDPLGSEAFTINPKDRCYVCKKAIFSLIMDEARKLDLNTVIEGTNADDVFDYRPGMKALAELNVRSPLKEAGLTKADIRELSQAEGLSTWDKPSFACLATRIPYGNTITAEVLSRIDKAEEFLYGLGIRQFRVRSHGELARIEVLPEDFAVLIEENKRTALTEYFKKIGYKYVSLDLTGYRTGSMN